MLQKAELNCYYTISKFQKHDKLKQKLLQFINNAESQQVIADTTEVNISRADWHNCYNEDRDWWSYVRPHLKQHLSHMFQLLGYNDYRIKEIWFQQYKTGSQHGWHIHSSNFTNVYYLDFPEDCAKTQLINPWDQKTIIEIDVKEGDILTFPSFVIHRAPPNISVNTKTIISYNIDMCYPDSQYQNNLTNNRFQSKISPK
jgi:hypothetical protein